MTDFLPKHLKGTFATSDRKEMGRQRSNVDDPHTQKDQTLMSTEETITVSNDQLRKLLASTAAQEQPMALKTRRIPRMAPMVPRGSVILWLTATAIVSFGLGGVKTAWHYQDQIHPPQEVGVAALGK